MGCWSGLRCCGCWRPRAGIPDTRRIGTELRICYSGYMSTIIDEVTSKVAARIRGEGAARRWSLDDLAERARVSKAMISKIERGEASPTATLLGRLSAAYGLTISALLAEDDTPRRGPMRAETQALWRDPATGYVRRQVAASATSPIE